ncbi:MAG: SH3 domain-containing protein [Candidatus Limiplasma sp.]|nr:SH3 domain-containing protein [Candidatus Limiplasma sp.]
MKRMANQTVGSQKLPRPRRSLTERFLPLFTDKAVAVAALLLALVFATVLLNTASAEEAPVTKYVLVDAGSCLNIREFPKAHAKVIIRMERGEELQVNSVSATGWADVVRAGDGGYCRVEYLCDDLLDAATDYTAATDKLRIRALPNAKATTVKKLRKGDAVSVEAFRTLDGVQWARVSAGFIMADYLSAGGA